MTDPQIRQLQAGLAQLGRELRDEHPPATLLPAIHRTLASRRSPATRVPRTGGWPAWAALSTACVALAAALIVVVMPEEDALGSASGNGFVALAASDAWQEAARVDAGRVWLVPTEIPQSRLAALGLPYDPTRANERVAAQLLMQGSGDVLAVRVEQP